MRSFSGSLRLVGLVVSIGCFTALNVAAGTPQPVPDSAQVTVQRYSLILYDFDSAEPSALHERVLKEYVYPDVTTQTQISIVGYSDVVGIEARNLALARQRAENIAARIRARFGTSGYASLTTAANIEEDALFTNSLPEGRMLSRTVVITFRNQPEQRWVEPGR